MPDNSLSDKTGINLQIENDLKKGLENLETYEKLYRNLKPEDKKYLKKYALLYREEVRKIQKIILPAVQRICSGCEDHCCRLHSMQHGVYTAGAPGGFSFKDFLFARFDNPLPPLNSENMKKNICPFWKNGCTLPEENRSLVCISWFCDALGNAVNMEEISGYLKRANSIIEEFSVAKCLGFR